MHFTSVILCVNIVFTLFYCSAAKEKDPLAYSFKADTGDWVFIPHTTKENFMVVHGAEENHEDDDDDDNEDDDVEIIDLSDIDLSDWLLHSHKKSNSFKNNDIRMSDDDDDDDEDDDENENDDEDDDGSLEAALLSSMELALLQNELEKIAKKKQKHRHTMPNFKAKDHSRRGLSDIDLAQLQAEIDELQKKEIHKFGKKEGQTFGKKESHKFGKEESHEFGKKESNEEFQLRSLKVDESNAKPTAIDLAKLQDAIDTMEKKGEDESPAMRAVINKYRSMRSRNNEKF
uniref:Uncharacterized protein n=1 Tax=Strigamia maritima TaxID=126957 RepID=T1IH46_STRMM